MGTQAAETDLGQVTGARDTRWLVELWRPLLILAALFPVGLWAVWPLFGVDDRPIAPGLWFLVTLSAIANIFVLAFHYTTPPHPKFVMLPGRRLWLRIHIISGSLEYLAGLAVLLLPGRTWPGLAMGTIALGFHVPSAFAQNRIVAGSRALMLPGYMACIVVHGFCAAMLLRHPNSMFWAVQTFLVFNTYAWVRVYYFVFQRFELFADSRYSIMVLAAGLTTMTPLLGPIWPLQFMLFLLVYIVLYRRLFAREHADYLNFVREHSRWSGISEEAAALWSKHQDAPEQRARAKEVFDYYDTAKTGRLRLEQLGRLLTAWALPPEASAAFQAQFSPEGFDFEAFFSHIWRLASVRDQATLAITLQAPKSMRGKARFVFDALDLNRDGTLEAWELRLLLLEWNLPPEETDKYFAVCDRNKDGKIDFEEFYEEMRPVWRYLFYDVLSPSASGILSRSPRANARVDDRAVRKQYERTRRELVDKVPFLHDAPDAFLGELAEAFRSERFEPGEAIILEWTFGDRFYFLVEGEADVTRRGEHLSTLNAGASFGESALFLDARRTASVIARSTCVLYSVARTSFRALVDKHPSVRARMDEIVSVETRSRIRASLMQLLQVGGSPSESIAELAELLGNRVRERCYVEGEELMKEGDEGDNLFVLHSGHVRVSRGGEELARCGPGDCLGEIALLTGMRRTATVTALDATIAFTLSREDLHSVTEASHEFHRKLLDLHRQRVSVRPGAAG